MDMSSRRRIGGKGSVVAGSVWESRMKSDEVRGGVKVFNGEQEQQNAEEEEGGGGTNSGTVTKSKRNPIGGAVATGKRKTWKSEANSSSDGIIKRNPIQLRKLKSEGSKKIGASADKFERTPIQTRKLRSEAPDEGESSEGHDRSFGQLRKCKSDLVKTSISNQSVKNAAGSGNCNVENSVQLRKTTSESDHVSELEESKNEIDDGKIPVENEKKNNGDADGDDDEKCKDFGVCHEQVISSSSENVDQVHHVGDDSESVIDDEADEGEEVEMIEMEKEKEKESFDVKEITIPESKVVKEPENNKVAIKPENKMVVNEAQLEKKEVVNEPEPKKIVSTQKRFYQNNERPVCIPLTVKQSPPIRRHSTIYPNFSKPNSIPKAEEQRSFPQTQNKVQNLVDLIMWRDISRSAFVFGIGTFIIVSSSYAKDINLSVVSVVSYLGLVYLAVIFLYRSLICRGIIDVEDTNYVVGEEEAIWMLRLIFPYLNEFLSKLKALFSGDPGTTMKLAVLLFVLARCGSSITIWKMAKFGFFGVFTVPKICSSYSAQLTAYGNFWIRRFRDAWDSCSHKKAVALGIFGLVWNLSSVVARIWAVFVLFVAFRYYQQHYLVRDEWVEDAAEAGCDGTFQEPLGVGVGVGVGIGRQRQGRAPNFIETNKVKKGL